MKRSKTYTLCIVLLLLCAGTTHAQPNKTQFEKERQVLLQRIQNIQRVLTQTLHKKKDSTGRLEALNRQIESDAMLIQTISQEMLILNQEIQKKQQDIATLEQELAQLKKEYAAMVYVGAKAMHDIHTLMFIFAAPSFQKLVQRLRYVRQYTRIRQTHFNEIGKVVALLQTQKAAAEQRQQAQSTLLQTKQQEKARLASLRQQQAQMVSTLEQQRTQLEKELQQRNKAVQRLDKLIQDIVAQDMAQQESAAQQEASTPEPTLPTVPPKQGPTPSPKPRSKPMPPAKARKLTAQFRKSRGKLPWPVKDGFISGKFGICPHPVLRDVQVENLGIDLQTQAGTQAQAIFEGLVKTIAFVPGMHRVVIIQHGDFHSVYARLKDTTVSVGQYVKAGESLGTIYTDKNGITELQLQLWQHTQKLNPALWLSKK
jgi:septal ring factor EnvC (AmiA/AmiB activator)